MKKVFIFTALFLTQLSLASDEDFLAEKLKKMPTPEAYVFCQCSSQKPKESHPDYVALNLQNSFEEQAKEIKQVAGDLSATQKNIRNTNTIFPLSALATSMAVLLGGSFNELPLAMNLMGTGMSVVGLLGLVGRFRIRALRVERSALYEKGSNQLAELEENFVKADILLCHNRAGLEESGAAHLLAAIKKDTEEKSQILVEIMKESD